MKKFLIMMTGSDKELYGTSILASVNDKGAPEIQMMMSKAYGICGGSTAVYKEDSINFYRVYKIVEAEKRSEVVAMFDIPVLYLEAIQRYNDNKTN